MGEVLSLCCDGRERVRTGCKWCGAGDVLVCDFCDEIQNRMYASFYHHQESSESVSSEFS